MKLLRKIWVFVKSIFTILSGDGGKYLNIAVEITEKVKDFVFTKQDIIETIKRIIPGEFDDRILDKMTDIIMSDIENVLLNLNLIKTVTDKNTPEQRIKNAMQLLQNKEPGIKATVFHGIALNLSIYFNDAYSDGKLTVGELARGVMTAYKLIKNAKAGK